MNEKKDIGLSHIKLDIVKKEKDELIIGEVKKSSLFRTSARMQLAYYLLELEKVGLNAKGELYFPKEKKRETIELVPELRKELNTATCEILRILYFDAPPLPEKIRFCKNCAYAEFCWS